MLYSDLAFRQSPERSTPVAIGIVTPLSNSKKFFEPRYYMMFMCSVKRFFRLTVPFLMLCVAFSLTAIAQTKKKPAKSSAKTTSSKTTKTTAKKTSKKTSSKEKATAKNSKKTDSKKLSKKELAAAKKKEEAASKKGKKADPKKTAAEKRAEAARKKKEEAQRLAALEAQRRREQAAREARARKIAFENGLKTETRANISQDKTEGENLRVREAAVEALGSRAGTVVVMEAKTGKIVTMVNQDWAIHDGFKPCSTIKLVTGVAGLNEGVINGDGSVAGETMKLELDDALAYSNNAYFQRVGVKMGTDKMIEYAKDLGLGQKTGINAANEYAGKLPYGNSNPRIYSHADDFEVTPLQLAVLVSALSNGGERVVPFIPKARTEKASYKPHSKSIGLPMDRVKLMLPGMMGAASYGTARRGVDASMGVAGKTGSCIGKGTWVGLFASVAPVEDPMYSVVVITRGQSERGRYAAAVAGKVYEALRPMMERPRGQFLNSDVAAIPIRSKINADEVGDEEDDDVDTPDGERETIIVGAPKVPVETPAVKKLVTKTAQSKPVFKKVVITVKKRPEEKQRPRIVKNK